MEEVNKNTELNDIDKKLHISDVIDSKMLESFYTVYDVYCMNLHEGGFFVEWLSKDEFMKSIKTYDDLVKLHLKIGYIDNVSDAYYL